MYENKIWNKLELLGFILHLSAHRTVSAYERYLEPDP